MSEATKIPLANTKKGFISITTIDEPYGAGTESVASIAISLNGTDIEWKVHIPMTNLDEVISSLQNLK
jgi:hypothetical protein